jgi:hypothetical protein
VHCLLVLLISTPRLLFGCPFVRFKGYSSSTCPHVSYQAAVDIIAGVTMDDAAPVK